MTIKTLDVPGAVAFHSVVTKIRKRCECGSDPDGYFTYTEKVNTSGLFSDDTKIISFNPVSETVYEKNPSQYFLGDEDIKILKGFFTPETGCRNQYEEAERRRFWWRTIESELFAECELTAPITFWAADPCSKWFNCDPNPVWDLGKYGEVSAAEFLESLDISGKSILDYRQLSVWWHGYSGTLQIPLKDAMIPWIEQLPYADIFICNKDLYVQTCDTHCYGG